MMTEVKESPTPFLIEWTVLGFLYLGSSYYLEVEVLRGNYLDYHLSGWWVAYLVFWSGVLFLLDKLRYKLKGLPKLYDFHTGGYFLSAGMLQGFSLILGAIISIFLGICMGWGFYPFATCEALY